MRRFIATISYITMIVFLNTLFVTLPGICAYGQSFSAADVFVGGIYIARDFAQRELKHYVFFAMLIGAAISYLLASKTIALASVSAFVVGEGLDWLIYTFTKKPLSQRLVLSAIASSPIDSLVFLGVAGRLHWLEFSVMTLGKVVGVFVLWLLWKWKQSRRSIPGTHSNINA